MAQDAGAPGVAAAILTTWGTITPPPPTSTTRFPPTRSRPSWRGRRGTRWVRRKLWPTRRGRRSTRARPSGRESFSGRPSRGGGPAARDRAGDARHPPRALLGGRGRPGPAYQALVSAAREPTSCATTARSLSPSGISASSTRTRTGETRPCSSPVPRCARRSAPRPPRRSTAGPGRRAASWARPATSPVPWPPSAGRWRCWRTRVARRRELRRGRRPLPPCGGAGLPRPGGGAARVLGRLGGRSGGSAGTVERLKAAELRDYFRDDCVAELEAKTASLETWPREPRSATQSSSPTGSSSWSRFRADSRVSPPRRGPRPWRDRRLLPARPARSGLGGLPRSCRDLTAGSSRLTPRLSPARRWRRWSSFRTGRCARSRWRRSTTASASWPSASPWRSPPVSPSPTPCRCAARASEAQSRA